MATNFRKTTGNPKYKTAEHRKLRAHYATQLRAGLVLTCTATTCVMPSRAMTNPNGNAPDGLHLGHNDDGTTYAGPQHNACNVKDGARRGRAKQNQPRRWRIDG